MMEIFNSENMFVIKTIGHSDLCLLKTIKKENPSPTRLRILNLLNTSEIREN